MTKKRPPARKKRPASGTGQAAPRTYQKATTAIAVTIPTSCPRCGSTQRTKYTRCTDHGPGVTWFRIEGVQQSIPERTPYETMWKRYTSCEKCGQVRVDTEFVFAGKYATRKDTSEVLGGDPVD